MSDSRFTLSTGGYVNWGRKIYPVARDAAFVFAGDVLSAQRAARLIRRLMRARGVGALSDPAIEVGRLLALAHTREKDIAKARPRTVYPLTVIAAICDRRHRAQLVYYSSRAKFQPIHLVGVHALGPAEDRRRFQAALEQQWRDRQQRNDVSFEHDQWHIDLVSSARSAVEHPSHSKYVGGRLQTVIVTDQGWRETNFSFTAGDPLQATSWTKACISISEARPFNRSDAAALECPADLGVHAVTS